MSRMRSVQHDWKEAAAGEIDVSNLQADGHREYPSKTCSDQQMLKLLMLAMAEFVGIEPGLLADHGVGGIDVAEGLRTRT